MLLVELSQAVTFALVFPEPCFAVSNTHFPCAEEAEKENFWYLLWVFILIRETKAFPQGTGVNSLLRFLLPEEMCWAVNEDEAAEAI